MCEFVCDGGFFFFFRIIAFFVVVVIVCFTFGATKQCGGAIKRKLNLMNHLKCVAIIFSLSYEMVCAGLGWVCKPLPM